MAYAIDGSAVLLTGASSGIGRELGKELAGRGARLALAARRRPLLESLAEEIRADGGAAPAVLEADLSTRGAAQDLALAAAEALGGVDALVNNAGGGVGGRVVAVGDRDEAREAFEINYWSPLALIGALAPAMLARKEGAIVNVTSMGQVSTWPSFGAYAATKAAFSLATETLAMELDGSGVHVMEVLPGPVDTAVQGETRLAPGIERMLKRVPLGDAATMARRIADGLERRRRRVIYPRRAGIGYYLPALVRWDGRRLARRAARELGDQEALAGLVVRTGSMGDEITQQARQAWESSRGRG
ncbi:MAG TPA: SDR family NAD(P)-dependent oxidoreductase [Solirubrobacterales bacterium]|nr:SDR family NAD(P)-dependent oxidoreductase [Solirubrobacterales bacterium]